jgi:midasin (ATPase involved in ribosome maturation)
MFKQGDRVRIKGNLDTEFEKYQEDNYIRERLKNLAGALRTVAYTGATDRYNGIDLPDEIEIVHFRSLGSLPASYVEHKIKVTKKAIKLDKLTDNTILGQDKIKKQLKHAIAQDMPALLIGETGTGKTTLIKDLAEQAGKKYLRFNLTGETTVDEFVGKYTLENGQTKWMDGVLLYAMRNGLWLIVDEINVALPEILFVLHSLLDDDKSVLVAQHNGETVKPHADFKFFATMNPVEEYAGTKDLNKAFMSRFGMIVKLEYPKPEYEKAILMHKAGVDQATADKLVDIAIMLRQAKADGEIFYTCSTRDLIQLGKLSGALGLQDAIQVTVINKANGDSTKIKEYIRRVVQLYKETEQKLGTLNIEEVKSKILELSKEVDFKKEKLALVESDLEYKQNIIEQKEIELANKLPELKAEARREILRELSQ